MSGRLRTFLAVELPDAVRAALEATIAGAGVPPGKCAWVPRENLHLTLAFLGAIAPERVDALAQGMAALARRHAPFELELTAPGAFPSARRPSVLWVGLRPSTPLLQLQTEVDVAVRALGFELESRPYHPHITCARVKVAAHEIGRRWSSAGVPPARWPVRSIALMRSETGAAATRYTALQRFELKP